jgi:V8-like Glu-specific endopeptidase
MPLGLVMIIATVLIQPSSAAADGDPGRAITVAADPMVGPLFPGGVAAGHNCNASVLSAGQDLLLTAAHCVAGTAAGVEFVPGYDGTQAHSEPFGTWTVTRAWVPAAWAHGQDPQHDYAILQVSDHLVAGRAESINSLTGGNIVGFGMQLHGPVTVPAYPAGAGDAPISCHTQPYLDRGYPTFSCGGYFNGTSGAPWLHETEQPGVRLVVGVIGGLHQGGCDDSTSYSSTFDGDVWLLMIRATLGDPGDDVPARNTDGC